MLKVHFEETDESRQTPIGTIVDNTFKVQHVFRILKRFLLHQQELFFMSQAEVTNKFFKFDVRLSSFSLILDQNIFVV